MSDERDDIRLRYRMDVVEEVTSFDPGTGHIEVLYRPDPRRYERQERESGAYWFDRFDRTLIPHSVVMDMLKQAVTMPRPSPVSVLAELDWYLDRRRPLIEAGLDGQDAGFERHDASEEFLASRAGDRLGFVVLSVDVVDSSKFSNSVDGQTLARVFGTLLTEMAQLVALFHGHVLRYEGDGLIAYFPEPSFITKNDFAIDCAHCLRVLVYGPFNAALAARSLPPFEVRFGLDAGQAAVVVLGASATKRHADIIGDVVSLACNIQAAATPGDVLLGDVVEHNLHVTWRTLTEPAPLPDNWSQRAADGQLYRMHRLAREFVRPIEAASTKSAS